MGGTCCFHDTTAQNRIPLGDIITHQIVTLAQFAYTFIYEFMHV